MHWFWRGVITVIAWRAGVGLTDAVLSWVGLGFAPIGHRRISLNLLQDAGIGVLRHCPPLIFALGAWRLLKRTLPPPGSPVTMYCRWCGYGLEGLFENRCPECGKEFDPTKKRTYRNRPLFFGEIATRRIRVFVRSLPIICGVALIGGLFLYWEPLMDEWRFWRHVQLNRRGDGIQGYGTTDWRPTKIHEWYADKLLPNCEFLGLSEPEVINSLSLRRDLVTDNDLSRAARFPHLDSLNLSRFWRNGCIDDFSNLDKSTTSAQTVTDEGLKHLKNCENLRFIALGCTEITDRGLAYLGQLPNVRSLSLAGTSITDDGLAHLANLDTLQSLDLRYTDVTGDGIRHLASLRSLEKLVLRGNDVRDRDLAHLHELANLKSLDLSGTMITDIGLEELSALQTLAELDISGTQVTNDGFVQLKECQSLEEVKYHDTYVSRQALRELRSALPKWRVVPGGWIPSASDDPYFRPEWGSTPSWFVEWAEENGLDDGKPGGLDLNWMNHDVTDEQLSVLEKLAHLRSLNISGTWVTGEGIATLSKFKSLRSLSLGNTEISDTHLSVLKDLKGLRKLSLSGTRISDAGMTHLRHLTLLSEIDVSNTAVTDEGIKHLRDLRNLSRVSLTGTKLTDAGLEHLRELPWIETLDVSETAVTDDGLAPVGGMRKPLWLSVRNTKITAQGLARIRRAGIFVDE
jgi:Leucine-rich repeat (LRR) protein